MTLVRGLRNCFRGTARRLTFKSISAIIIALIKGATEEEWIWDGSVY